ncbi:MAG: hypothetical protein HKN22_02150 [Bacteroidia bacterium]|nr:hypothetical protein [Bacteroidia bacterium]
MSDINQLEGWIRTTFEVPVDRELNESSIRTFIQECITELIEYDLQRLYQLLYRIDIDENKLKENLKNAPLADSASLITDMIIERQLKKFESRKKYR